MTSDLAKLNAAAATRQAIADRGVTLPDLAARIDADSRLPRDLRDILMLHCLAGLPSLADLCPTLLRLHGQPYSLQEHFLFEPLFDPLMPKLILFMVARQMAKTTSLAAQGIVSSAAISNFNTLYVEPLYEMTRRLSTNYVEPFLRDGPLADLLYTREKAGSVLQRSLPNGSTMYFSYGMYEGDVVRSRGIPVSRLTVDEVQNISYEAIRLYAKTMGGIHSWQICQMAGTPMGFDNTIQMLFNESSQAEWLIRCRRGGCNHWNIPNVENDLLDMIGPWSRDLGPGNAALVCSKCRKPLEPRSGRWYHFVEEQRHLFPGYHAPQVVLPFHCENPDMWASVLEARDGDERLFFNEILAQSRDVGHTLIGERELKRAASLPWRSKSAEAFPHAGEYSLKVLAADWGGGGGRIATAADNRTTRTSFTKLAAIGTNGGGRVDVFWGHASTRTHDKLYEAKLVRDTFKKIKAKFLVHDAGGEGGAREALLLGGGMSPKDIVPYRYHGPSKALTVRHPPSNEYPRTWWGLDKSRALGIIAMAIRVGLIRFFSWEKPHKGEPGLIGDFTALFEERFTGLPLNDVFRIATKPGMSDDFAQACCIGIAHLWTLTQSWPDFGDATKRWYLDDENLEAAFAESPEADWTQI